MSSDGPGLLDEAFLAYLESSDKRLIQDFRQGVFEDSDSVWVMRLSQLLETF